MTRRARAGERSNITPPPGLGTGAVSKLLPCSPSVCGVAPPNPLLDLPGMPALRERVEKGLATAVEADDPAMTEMASHLVRAGGKRLRPLLAALASTAGSGPSTVSDDAVTGGVACELVHVGSLHHDDGMQGGPH